MRARRVCRSGLFAVVGLSLAFLMAGCLVWNAQVFGIYNSAKDEFRFLVVLEDIRTRLALTSADPQPHKQDAPVDDIRHLESLYRNRDQLIIVPTPGIFMVDFASGCIRISDSTAATVSLNNPVPASIEQSPIHLGKIQILPGEFFTREGGGLCLYHQIIVPGAVVDQTVDAINEYLKRYMKEHPEDLAFYDKILARRRSGEKPAAWDAWTKQTISRQLNGPTTNPFDDPSGIPLETRSIQNLRDASAGGPLRLRRQGADLVVELPLTEADTRGAIAFMDQFRRACAQKATDDEKPGASSSDSSEFIEMILNALTFSTTNQGHLRVSLDVIAWVQCSNRVMATMTSAPDDGLAGAMAKEFYVDHALTVQQVEADFFAGHLASHPQQPPVPPGEGLLTTQPTTQP